MIIFNGLDDQTFILVWGVISRCFYLKCPSFLSDFYVYKDLFFSLRHPFSSNEPITSLFIAIVTLFFGINSLNILFLISVIFNLFLSYVLFKRFKYGSFYALIYTFSSYTWSHFGIHLDLFQIWIFPMFIYLFLKYKSRVSILNSVYLGIYIVLSSLISNYNGFLVLLLLFCYSMAKISLDFLFKKTFDFMYIRFIGIVYAIVLILLAFVLFPYVKANYLRNPSEQKDFRYIAYRPFEDFVTFSSRPWYFFIPSTKNPIFSGLSKKVLVRLQKSQYFLTNNYFATEHSGSYFGLLLLSTLILSVVYVLKKNSIYFVESVLPYFFTMLLLVSFMMPPFFSISGIKVYTPSYLIYVLFLVFRVTARISVLVLLFALMSLAQCIDYIYKNINFEFKKYVSIFIIILTFWTLAETYIPPKILIATNPPDVYKYLFENKPRETIFAVYPYGKSQEALFWLPVHQQYLLNPRGYISSQFDSSKFTKNLSTVEGIKNFKYLGGTYILVYKEADNEGISFFKSYDALILDKEFSDSYLFRIDSTKI